MYFSFISFMRRRRLLLLYIAIHPEISKRMLSSANIFIENNWKQQNIVGYKYKRDEMKSKWSMPIDKTYIFVGKYWNCVNNIKMFQMKFWVMKKKTT